MDKIIWKIGKKNYILGFNYDDLPLLSLKAGSLQVRIRRNANENHVLQSVVRCLTTIVPSLRVEEFHEPHAAFVTTDHPPEYYIDEILPRTTYRQSSGWKEMMDRDVKVMRIDEILDRKTHRGKTFARAHQTNGVRLRDDSKCNSFIVSEKRTIEFASIYQNDNIKIENHLYRDKYNVLFDGMKMNENHFKHLQINEKI